MKRDSTKLLVSSIRRLVRADRRTQLRKIVNKSHPADLAHIFGSLTPGQRLAVIHAIRDPEAGAIVLSELDGAILEDVLGDLADDELAQLLEHMPSDDLTDLLQWLDEGRKELLLGHMTLEEQSEAESLMGYDPESAGGLMSTDYFSLEESTSAGEAVRQLQEEAGEAEVIFYLYVVNEHEQLVGVSSLRELVRAPKDEPLRNFMITEVIRVDVNTDQEEVARLVARYNLLALPVVDPNNRLVGVVTVDDIIDVIRLEATEDIMKMAGAGEEVSPHRSPMSSFRSRLPWLVPSFIAGILGVLVISYFERYILAFVPLAALIPMVMGMAGNMGTQSSTIVTRWLAIGKLEFMDIGRIVVRELGIGLACGVVYGALIGGFVGLYFGGELSFAEGLVKFALTSGAAVMAAMGLAAGLGAALPLAFEKLGLDPAMATGPFVSTTIDVLAVWLYLATAALILG